MNESIMMDNLPFGPLCWSTIAGNEKASCTFENPPKILVQFSLFFPNFRCHPIPGGHLARSCPVPPIRHILFSW